GPDPVRQADRLWPVPVPGVRDQHRLAGTRPDRYRPARLDPAAAGWRAGHRRAETVALPAADRRRPDHPQRQANPATHRHRLALGGRAGRRVHPPGRPTTTGNLTHDRRCPPSTVTGTRPAPAGLTMLPTDRR